MGTCYLLVEAGIRIAAPVHDAVLIEVDAETADEDIRKAEHIMREASVIILGHPLRVETVTVRYPDRYVDERGKETWEKVLKILQGIQNSPCEQSKK